MTRVSAPGRTILRYAPAASDEEEGMANASLTWLGHAAFRVDSPEGKRIYVDPWLENPKCPEGEKEPERVDLIALTHGHDDHVGATIELAQKFGCPVIAMVELRGWLSTKGLSEDATEAANKGGTVQKEGIKITLTDAKHSSSAFADGSFVYLGEPTGLVIELENGTKLYFAGDTGVFGDMQLIGRIYQPDVAILPIGGHYTMDPREAAVALELLGVKRCVPCHYGTFELLAGTPDELRKLAPGVEIIAPAPGETVEL
jgi:L-ascorbate metabolism protein UlaG (beta-lactamase superfamily)